MSNESLVLEGSFDAFSIDEVLDVVGLSRQYLELVLDEEKSGSVLVKSGNVLRARRPPDEGRDAFVRLYRRPGASFQVFRRDTVGKVEPIGSLSELIHMAREAAEAPAGQLVLEGTFDQFSLVEVLDVIGLSRQSMELELETGSLLVKAGQVVWARTGAGSSGREAFVTLFRSPGNTFRVTHRRDEPLHDPIGSLRALLERSRGKAAPRPSEASRVVVAEGSLADFTLREVLDVVSISRQHIEVELRRAGTVVGSLWLKAGQVLDARHHAVRGDRTTALKALLKHPGTHFAVFHHPELAEVRDPLGSLASLVGEREPAPVADDDITVIAPRTPAPQPSPDTAAATLEALEKELERQGEQIAALARARVDDAAAMVEALNRSGDRMLLGAVLVAQLVTVALVLLTLAVAMT